MPTIMLLHSINATVMRLDRRERSCVHYRLLSLSSMLIIMVSLLIFTSFSSFFLKFDFLDVDFDVAGDFLTPYRVGSIVKICSNEAE